MTRLRPDLQIIADNIAPGSRVLDIGCGDGALMAALRDQKGCDARGISPPIPKAVSTMPCSARPCRPPTGRT